MIKRPYTEPQIKVVRFAVELGNNLSATGSQEDPVFQPMEENTQHALSGNHFTQS